MRRPILLAALTASIGLAACGGSVPPAGPGSTQGLGPATGPGSASGATTPSTVSGGDQFGGDVCTALTRTEIEAATYPQGDATFGGTDTLNDPASGKAVACQYLVAFDDIRTVVGVTVSLMDDTEYGTRTSASLTAPPVALTGIGSEAFLIQPAPGIYEVWVAGAHGKFKLGAQSKDTAIALATIAALRD